MFRLLSARLFMTVLCALFSAVVCITDAGATVWGKTSEPPIRVAALQRTDLEEISSQEAILLDRLRREFHPRQVTLQYYDSDSLEHAVKNNSVDFIITDSLFYAGLKLPGMRLLAGLVFPEAVDADHMTAATVFVRRSYRESDSLISSLKGRKAVILEEGSFGGDIAFKVELLKHTYKPEQFFKEVESAQGSYVGVVKSVLESDAVGILPACTIERLAREKLLDMEKITVVNNRRGGGLDCLRSTGVYPSWLLASLPDVDMSTIRKVTSVALISSMPGSLQWSFPPADFEPVHNILIDLQMGPYADLHDRFWQDVLLRYRWWIGSALLLILAVVLHSFIVARLVRIRTRDLQNLMVEQRRMTDEMLETRARLQSMEKVQTVSQMSTIIAHELKQPLAALRNFALGLVRRSERGELDAATMRSALEKMLILTDQASNIVNHVRSYVKNESTVRQKWDFGQIVSRAVDTYRKSTEGGIRVVVSLPSETLWVEINSWEIELAVHNLLKNAAEASQDATDPLICVRVFKDEHHALVTITDNGKGLDEAMLKEIFRPLFSTKASGLGLGLSIAVTVAESHGGRINARRNEGPGLTMEMVLPLCKET